MTEKIFEFCTNGDIEGLQALGCSKQDLIRMGDNDKTALHIAAENGHLKIVRFLVPKVGVNYLNVIDADGQSPYDVAVKQKF